MNWLYENNENNTVRYILGKRGKKPLICFGINPSTAEPCELDNTPKSVERLSKNNGYDSWIMLNIYPQRATNPNDIHINFDSEIHTNNLKFIDKLLAEFNEPTIWAAWGTLIEIRPYFLNCLKDIYEITLTHNCNWITFGNNSNKGHPHHPLYLNSKTESESFDIDNYIKMIGINNIYV